MVLTAAAATLALAARLQCPRCSSALVAPRSFPCNHSFCSECAEESVNDSNGCSVCHRPFHVRDARDNHMLLALVALSVELSGKANELTHAGIEATRLGRERAALLRRAQAAASGGEGEGGGARAHLPEESPPKVGRASDAADVAATRDRNSSHVAAGTGGAAAPAVTAAKAAAPRGAAPAALAPAPPPTAASSGASVTSPSGAPPTMMHAPATSLEAPARSPPAAAPATAPTAALAAAPPPPALPRSAPPPPPHRLSGAALAVHGPRILCGTSLDAAYRERLLRVGALVQGSGGNGGGTTDEFDPTRVTHLITRTTTPAPGRRVSELVTEMLHPQAPRATTSTSVDTDTTPLVCKRTLKYVQAVLCGCWVLSAEWLDACLEAGRVVDEGPFELTGDWGNPLTLAPKRGREAAAAGCVQTLFAGLRVRILEPLDLTSRQEMALLVRCGGGTLVVDGVGGGAGGGGAGAGEGEKAGEVTTVGTIGSLESSWASCGGLPARDRMLRDAAATGLRVLSQQFFLDSASHMELREPGAYELRAPPPPEGTAKGKVTATRRGERLG